MKSILKVLLGITALSLIGVLYYLYTNNVTQITPYTYSLPKLLSEKQRHRAENAQILIIGDQRAETLKRFTPEIASSVSKNLSKPIKIAFLSHEHDGLHRSLKKSKN